VRSLLAEHECTEGTIGMITVSEGGTPVTAHRSVDCPFEPSDSVVLKRISVSGNMNDSGFGSIAVQMRGYIDPS